MEGLGAVVGLGVAVGPAITGEGLDWVWSGGLVGAGIFCPPEQADVNSVIARKYTNNHRYVDIFSSLGIFHMNWQPYIKTLTASLLVSFACEIK
jgi:hypothetical protein